MYVAHVLSNRENLKLQMKVSLSKFACPESVLCSDPKTPGCHVAQNKIIRADVASICLEGIFFPFKGSTG